MADSSGFFNGRPIEDSIYNYVPSRTVAIILLTFFAISTLGHIGQAIRFRTWFLLFTAGLCGFAEVIGWSGRLWSSYDPFLRTPYIMQSACLVVAPTPLLAASFIVFGRIVQRLGPAYSRLSAKWYTIVFCTCDIISLLVQGAGGGIAASAETPSGIKLGGDLLLVGIGFQLGVIVIFAICVTEYYIRYILNAPISRRQNGQSATVDNTTRGEFTLKLKLMTYGIIFMTTVLFIRAVYRTIELADGWKGPIFSNQLLFNILDGEMTILAIYTLNIAHPGLLLAPPPPKTKETYPLA